MPRKPKTEYKQYQEKTEMIAVRIPASLHSQIKRLAARDGMPKSRKIVEMLENGMPGKSRAASVKQAPPGSVFE